MRKKTLSQRSVVLRPRVMTKGRPSGDAVASAILTMMEDGWFQEEKRCSVVFDPDKADHAAALAILEKYTPTTRAEVLRAAIAFSHATDANRLAEKVGPRTVAVAPYDAGVRKAEAATAENGRVEQKEEMKVKVDPALKSLRGLL